MLQSDFDGHWVVDVEDVRDLAKNLPGYRRRFIFEGEGASDRAWECLVGAERHGFKVDVQRVKAGLVTGGEKLDTERSADSS